MSELALFKNGIPEYLRNAEADDATKALAGNKPTKTGVSSMKRISIKAGVFRMIVDGKEIAQNEDRAMPIIIAAAAPYDARTYYSKPFVEGQAVSAPDCWSNDGKTPDPKAENAQAARCIDCKQNIAGSGQGNSRACKYSRRLAVLLENDPKADVHQLTLPSNSLWGSEGGKLGIKHTCIKISTRHQRSRRRRRWRCCRCWCCLWRFWRSSSMRVWFVFDSDYHFLY